MLRKREYERKLVNDVVESILRHGGHKCLSSIIVTGSFGRYEPTYKENESGVISLTSDVEIALIYKYHKQKNVEYIINKVSEEFKEDLNLMAIGEKRIKKIYNFNFSIISPKKKTIFMYDIFNGSYTAWGKDYIKLQTVSLEDVDPYEAKRLVANRIGELSYLITQSNGDSYIESQWKGKLMLAIVSAWLICNNNYVSSYHGQLKNISIDEKHVKKVLGDNFLDEYKKVFIFLRENGVAYEVSDENLKIYVKNINRLFKDKKLNKPKVNSMSRYIKYLVKYMKTSMEFGFLNFEDKILQSIIDAYILNESIKELADIWHKVLY